MRKVEFDTTGSGYFLTQKGYEPNAEEIEEALADARLNAIKVKRLEEIELPETKACFEVSVKGLA